MPTFDEEYKKLVLWLQAEHEKIDAKGIPWDGGLDGEKDLLERQLGVKYRERLRELRRKYNR